MKFEYKAFMPSAPNEKWVRMPFVEATIFGPRDSRKGIALVDSGAEYCLINLEFAEKIGIDLSRARQIDFHGVAGHEHVKQAYIARVTIQVRGMEEKIEVEAGFIDSSAVSIILGQQDFFDQHRIKFEKDHNVFEIVSVSKK